MDTQNFYSDSARISFSNLAKKAYSQVPKVIVPPWHIKGHCTGASHRVDVSEALVLGEEVDVGSHNWELLTSVAWKVLEKLKLQLGDGSVSQVPGAQTCGPEFDLQHLCENPDMAVTIYNLCNRDL